VSTVCEDSDLQKWHEVSGHINEVDLKSMIRNEKVIGIKLNLNENMKSCEICIQGKQSKKPFTKSDSKSSDLLELVHSDVCGPMRVKSHGSSRYFVTFIDDKTRWCEIYFLKQKSEVIEKFKEYMHLVENQTGRKIKTLRTDNGKEYVKTEFSTFLKEKGIKHELTNDYTP